MVTKIWSFIGLGSFIAGVVTHIITPEYPVLVLSCFAASFIILSFFSVIHRKQIKEILKSSHTKNALTQVISVGLIFSIFGVLNYLFYKNDKVFDLTTKKYHTLSLQSQKIISSLEETLEMTLFAKRGDWDYYLSNLDKYANESKKIKLEALDIDSNLSKVRFNNITENGTLLLKYKGRTVQFKIESELNITNNILKVIRTRQIKLYYTASHGELDMSSKQKIGGDVLSRNIKASNYELIQLDLPREGIPNDADALMIIAPRYGFLDSEIDKLSLFLEKGGNLILLIQSNLLGTNFQNLYDLILKNGVKVHESIVIDRLAKTQGSEFTTPVVNEFNKTHPISKNFKGRLLFPLSLIFEISNEASYLQLDKLMWTAPSPAAWAETDVQGVINGKSALDENDFKGPVTLSVAIKNSKNHSKIILFGSGTFISNAFESQSQNFNFFLNSLSWALDDEGIISLDRPGLKNNEKVLISLSQETLILFFILICIPGLFFGFAFFLYRRSLNL